MHNAPSVSYPVGRSVVFATVLLVVWGLGLAALCWWRWTVDAWAWQHGMTAIILLLCAGLAAWSWMGLGQGELRWTGSVWTWSTTIAPLAEGALTVHLDWQDGLLVSFVPFHGRRTWLCMVQSAQPSRWHALRCAVYSRATGTVVQVSN